MGKSADFQPRWLVSLMCQWARRVAAEEDGSIGYPRKAAFLTIGMGEGVKTDPTEFSAREYGELDNALEECRNADVRLWGAMMMYYKPWVVESFKQAGHSFGTGIYYERLHAAHARISSHILKHSQK